MANQNGTAQYIQHGHNEGAIAYGEAIVPVALANSDTFTVTMPPGVDPSFLPADAFVPAFDPAVSPQVAYKLDVFSHSPTTGVTVLKNTTGGAVPINCRVVLTWITA